MNDFDVSIRPFGPVTAPDDELAALHAFTGAMRRELMPDDPPTPFEEAVAVWRATASSANVSTWLARASSGQVLARGQVAFPRSGPNPHAVSGQLEVAAAHRRRGLTRPLLARMAGVMRDQGRPLMIANTLSIAPGGEALLRRLGAERGLETTVHELRMERLDRERVRAWLGAPDAGFELVFRDGPHPESDLEAIVELHGVMGTAPMGSLRVETGPITPAQLRAIEAMIAARGMERWICIARERATGSLAGFTEVYWQPRVPGLLTQGDTGVFPRYRGRGLGRWLKAAMLERVLRERPAVERVRTVTADVNDPMLAINRALGFEPHLARTVWQAKLEGIEAWLHAGAAS